MAHLNLSEAVPVAQEYTIFSLLGHWVFHRNLMTLSIKLASLHLGGNIYNSDTLMLPIEDSNLILLRI